MKRREFITLLGGAMAWPISAQTRQPGQIRRIGLLMIIPEGDSQSRADRDALGSGLHELGWISGRNVDLEYRWSDGDEPLSISLTKRFASGAITSPARPEAMCGFRLTTCRPRFVIAYGQE